MKTTSKENIYKPVTLKENHSSKEEIVKKSLISELLLSLKSGIFAFAVVFTFSIISKSLAYSLGSAKIFAVNINDVIFSFWAFLIFSFIAFLQHYITPHK